MRTIGIDPDDIIAALQLNATLDGEKYFFNIQWNGTCYATAELVVYDPNEPFDPTDEALIAPTAFVRDSAIWGVPPTRDKISTELAEMNPSSRDVDEIHARSVAAWRREVRKRVVTDVMLDRIDREVARVEITDNDEQQP
ncbi:MULTISPECIES: hypothetical protein [Natrialbaceae]|uniref:hypothetical protein n=1 Tax=Natrialbaceae TaxID=1644061 RepID=UPI00207CBE9D|nr:hypothetical protein [Natronococcus sp. CG52]